MIITITGTNSFLLKAELEKRASGFIAEHGDMAVEKIDCEEAEHGRIVEAIQNLPFLASRKLVLLRNPSANKEFTEKFDELLETIPETNEVLIYEAKLDKRTAYAKLLQKKTDFNVYDELGERELPAWLVSEAKAKGGSLSLSDANYLIGRAGTSQQGLKNELDKLLLYDPKITKDSIDLLTDKVPQSTIFELLDAAFSGNVKRTFELYEDQRAQRVEPQAIIPMLAWQLQALAVVKTAGNRSVEEIAKEAKINPFVVRKSRAIAGKLSLGRLKQLIHELLKLDTALKSTSIDADDALRLYLLQLAGGDKKD